jgi:hypothetical protein
MSQRVPRLPVSGREIALRVADGVDDLLLQEAEGRPLDAALSLLSRLAAAVPPPRPHTVRYAGVLAPASKLRPKIVPKLPLA